MVLGKWKLVFTLQSDPIIYCNAYFRKQWHSECVQVCSEYVILWVVFQNNYMLQGKFYVTTGSNSPGKSQISGQVLESVFMISIYQKIPISLLVLNMAWIEPWKGRGGCSIYQNCGWLTTTEDDECPPPLPTRSRPLARVVVVPTTDTPTSTTSQAPVQHC